MEESMMIVYNMVFELKNENLICPTLGEFFFMKRLLAQVTQIFDHLCRGEDGEGWVYTHEVLRIDATK